ncbi:Mov34/MPN/PAD-1 family protein [Spirosoma sp. BT702]|uniref:Mov34/MPN/PAD-1 family protein n=1 Tax=Spirosoma profusum TaxID=2771354 RepID=A0A927AP71_9BACT|nr:Mov34/MPN/PAD-1 family protein [Spirosoma profusum]MBD2703409.1 Mov34/MPN/PAD-1 family protein [Spirosoma profusum]
MNEPEALLFQRKAGCGKLKITSAILQQITAYAQLKPQQAEAGGILLGRFIVEADDVVIDEVTVPKTGDRRHRTGFWRSATPHQKTLNDSWFSSDGTCNYLGEWHTHPEPNPNPSGRDLNSWKEQLIKFAQDGISLFFVIVGTQHIAVWEATHKPFTYQKLKKI